MDNSSPNINRLLVIDDDPRISAFIAKVASSAGFETRNCINIAEFKEAYRDLEPTIVVTDLQMPEVDGIQLLRYLAEEGCTAAILIISGMDTKVIAAAKDLGGEHGLRIIGFMQKPVDVAELRSMLATELRCQISVTEDSLGEAINEGQLAVHYQPKAKRNAQGKWIIDGVEALVRWPLPRDGMIMPDEFIPLAEKSGLIVPLTQVVLDTSVQQMADWRDAGLNLEVSVNLSAKVLTELDFPDRLANLMAEHKLDHQMLTLEITESTAMRGTDVILDILARLRLQDFGLSMDDFGTGYSSFRQLLKLPFNELKIDRSFVSDIDNNPDARKMTTAMITLAHQLGLAVCTEGVETRATLDYLSSVDADHVQGYLISKPVPASQIPDCLKVWGEA